MNFFGLEIELFRIGDAAPAPVFNIVLKLYEWSKTVQRKLAEAGLIETKVL